MSDLDTTRIPPELQAQLATTFDFSTEPPTLAAFAAAVPTEIATSVEELCVADASRHEVHIDDNVYHVHCALDTLLLPFFVETASGFEIRSASPVSDSVISIDGSLDGIEVDPEDAVMSFGVARTGEIPNNGIDLDAVHRHFCPYVNAFRSEAEYDHWATETTDGISMPLSFDTAFALAQALSNHPSHHAPQ